MKKLASIFLIVLFLFNLIGYRLVYCYEQQQADSQLQASLDNARYNQADLLTIKVPLSLPYLPANTAFERVDGELNFKGKIYKYVKRRIAEGQLVLLCLPDYNKMRLQSEATDVYKNIADAVPNTGSKKGESKGFSLKNLSGEFYTSEFFYSSTRYFSHINCLSQHQLSTLRSFPHQAVEPPLKTA